MNTDIKSVGQKIQDIRKQRGITQEQLAEAMGLETISISKIETGRSYPTSENLAKIAKILSVHPKDLYYFSYEIQKDEIINEIYTKIQKISEKKLYLIYNITLLSKSEKPCDKPHNTRYGKIKYRISFFH